MSRIFIYQKFDSLNNVVDEAAVEAVGGNNVYISESFQGLADCNGEDVVITFSIEDIVSLKEYTSNIVLVSNEIRIELPGITVWSELKSKDDMIVELKSMTNLGRSFESR